MMTLEKIRERSRKRNELIIPFNKGSMSFRDMERCVGTLESIVERWHAVEAKRQATEAGMGDDEYDKLVDEFFWDVHQQIHQFSTHRLEKEKSND